MKNSKNIRLAATAVFAATGLTATTAAAQIVINGQTIDAGQLIAMGPQNQNRLPVLTYGGPGTFEPIRALPSREEIEFRVREIAAEHLEANIDSITASTPIVLNDFDGFTWRAVIYNAMTEYVPNFDEENGVEEVATLLSEKESPTLGDLVDIINNRKR